MDRVVRIALALLVAVAVSAGAAGCTARPDQGATPSGAADGGPDATDGSDPDAAVSGSSPGAAPDGTIPSADPAVSLEDARGRTPADAFDEHMAAVASGDADAVWKTYGCSPPAEFDAWAVEWEDAAETYSGARVLEERVTGPGSAFVRVVYRMTSGDDEVIVEEPGEWWRIEQVEGEWKVGWLPRQ